MTKLEVLEQEISHLRAELAAARVAPARYGCHCDLEPGQEPDGCVLDEGRPQDCVHAHAIKRREDCSEWRPITVAATASEPKGCGAQCGACAESDIGCNLVNDGQRAPEPSDEQIDALWREACVGHHGGTTREYVRWFARAVLALRGTK